MRKYWRMWAVGVLTAGLVGLGGAGCTKEMRKSRHLARGNADFQASRYDQAEVEYLKVLQVAPRTPVALARLGVIYYEQGRMLRALAALQRTAELEPDNDEVRLKLCLTRFSMGHFKEAREDAQSILKKQPGHEEALTVLAESALRPKELQETRLLLDTFRGPKDQAGYHVALAALLLKQGQVTNATGELQKALALDPKSPTALVAQGNLYWFEGQPTLAEPALKAAADLSPLRSSRRLRYADFKRRQGSPEEARRLLEDLTHKVPDYLPAALALAQLDLEEGKMEACQAVTQRVLNRAPESYEAMLLKGQLKLAQGDTTQAVTEFSRMAEIFQQSPQVQFELARAYLSEGDMAKAVPRLERAVNLNPHYPEAVVMLAEVRLNQGDATAAIRALTQLLTQRPQLGEAEFVLAAAYLAQQNAAGAVAVYRHMLEQFPKEPRVPVALAGVLAQQGQRTEARQQCAKALEVSPGFLPALQTLVDLDLADKQPQAALDRVNAEIARRPSAVELQLLLARVHLAQHDTGGAEAPLLKAIELAPTLRTPYQLLAQAYVDSQRPQLALDKLNGFVAKTNDAPVLMQIGMIQESLKNYTAARDAYEKLLAVQPRFSPALNNLAYIYAEHLGQPDKALAAAESARQLLPNLPSTADTLGWVWFRKGEYLKALPLLEEAAAKLPSDPEIQFHLGMTRYALGQETPARATLEAALQASKDISWKAEAQNRLSILALDPKTAPPTAQALLEKRVAEAPEDVVALDRLARVYDRDGAVDKAAKAYEQLLKRTPKNAPVLARLSQLYAGPLRNPQKALDLAKDAHAADPADAGIAQALGHLVLQSGGYKWAASLLQEAARSRPQDPALSYDLAWACYGLGQLKDATTAMQTSLAGGGEHGVDAKRFLALLSAYNDPAQRQAAVPQVDAALKADANYVPALMVSALLQWDKGNYAEAKKALEQVLTLNPLFAPAMRDLAVLCSQRFSDDAKAYDLALKARDTFPDDPNLAKALGILAYYRGKYSATAQYLQSLPGGNNDGESLYYLGMAQYQLKAKTASKAALQQALALNLQPKLAEQAKRVLTELK